MQALSRQICSRYNLIFKENLSLGCNSDMIFLATDLHTKKKLVVKAAITPNSIAEIEMNQRGYMKLRDHGLGFFIPNIIAYQLANDYAFIIMEYLGPNFLQTITISQDPMQIISSFIEELKRVYASSLVYSSDGQEAIFLFLKEVGSVYKAYVLPNVDLKKQMISWLTKVRSLMEGQYIPYCCFSNWDFTPDDVYLSGDGLKYSDPHDRILGIPIIDMACFGGLLKLYNILYGDRAYLELKRFATSWVANLLQISSNQAKQIFYLGKLFQCFMSIRFRHENNPGQAAAIFQEARKVVEKIIQ